MPNRQDRDRNTGNRGRRRHQQAWAPYNFVPMANKPVYAELDVDGIPQRHDLYDLRRHTGYFNVRLTTETPLFVRGMLTISEKEAGTVTGEKPNFFSIDGSKPVIPGSSLRGMLRTLVEIVTNSKMHFVSDNKLVYRAVFGRDSLAQDYRQMVAEEIGGTHFMYPSIKLRGGYLMRGKSKSGWVIRPAQTFHDETFVLVDTNAIKSIGIDDKKYQETYNVFVRPTPRTTYQSQSKRGLELELAQTNEISHQQQAGLESAKLVISGQAPKRHWYSAIYAPHNNNQYDIPIPLDMWNDYMIDRDLHRGIETRKIKNEGDPLFYVVDNKDRLIFFGPTMFFRMPYRNSIGFLMEKDMRQSNPAIDYAEAMFGYVSGQGETRSPSAYAGRISVTSAHTGQSDCFDRTIVPKILGSPKPTTFQHYLKQPNGWQTDTHQLRHYGDDSELRGHKLYWRQMINGVGDAEEPDRTKNPQTSSQHTIITPVRKGITFEFKVHFENLTNVELGALIWVLTLGDDENARHQLGMGKPLGLGVVKIEPKLIITNRQERYASLFNSDGSWFTGEQDATDSQRAQWVSEFKAKMGDFDSQQRIKELKALLRMQQPNPKFSYMTIEPNNDYDGRPVLPYPTEIDNRR